MQYPIPAIPELSALRWKMESLRLDKVAQQDPCEIRHIDDSPTHTPSLLKPVSGIP